MTGIKKVRYVIFFHVTEIENGISSDHSKEMELLLISLHLASYLPVGILDNNE